MTAPLPDWVKELRPTQVAAIDQIIEAFEGGADVVVLDAPTGSGKTLIAEMVRRRLGVDFGTYVAHSKSLQDQFLRDFPYARVLKGRANYPTTERPDLTAADCAGPNCLWCDPRHACPYRVAKGQADAAEVAVVNTAYLLSFKHPMFMREFIVIDECDTLESIVTGHYEFWVSDYRLRSLGLTAPVKGARLPTILTWLQERLLPAAQGHLAELRAGMPAFPDEAAIRALSRAENLADRARLLTRDVAGGRRWIRDYERPGFSMRPVEVSQQGAEVLWNRCRRAKWLAMSATVIDAQEWVRSTGVETAGLNWELVRLPNEWPRANRPIVSRTWGDMGSSGTPDERQRVIRRLVEICRTHDGENVLVHAVSYRLATQIVDALRDAGMQVMSYGTPTDRDLVLEVFKDDGGILVAASMDRGIDLPDNLCRVQIIPKVPYLNLGDRQVSERLRLEDGEFWYQVQAARSLVQMTGRGIRHQDDYAVTYILDAAFDRFYGKWSRLLPRWWRDSIVGELPEDWFTRREQPIA